MTDEQKLVPDIKAKWLAALRSDEYMQGRGYLCRHGEYCCLGVLQAVTALPKHDDGELIDYLAAKEIGLSVDAQTKLSTMNDDGDSFEEIAAFIEEHL